MIDPETLKKLKILAEKELSDIPNEILAEALEKILNIIPINPDPKENLENMASAFIIAESARRLKEYIDHAPSLENWLAKLEEPSICGISFPEEEEEKKKK